jgi:ribonuclease-3
VTDSSYDEQNNPVFISCVKVADVEIGSGKGYSKKESHQMAAKVAIKKLRENNELQEVLLEATKNNAPESDSPLQEPAVPD